MKYSIIKRPNPMNRDSVKFYASPTYGEEITIRELAADISKSCTLTPADITAVIESFLDKMPNYLKRANKVRMGDFGIFKLSFHSNGQDHEENVSPSDIRNLKVLFTPGARLKQELANVSYSKGA